MNPDGLIYEGTREKPVKPEDAARLDGYLCARAEMDREKMTMEKLEAMAAQQARFEEAERERFERGNKGKRGQ